jgi:hypothetical protein
MRRLAALLAAAPLVLAVAGCAGEKAKPPAADAKLCGATAARWWFDATGGDKLSYRLRGGELPLPKPTQTRFTTADVTCSVYSGKNQVGRFVAEVVPPADVHNVAVHLPERPAGRRFSAAGGQGAVDPDDNGNGARAWWTCEGAVLRVEVYHPRDVKKRVELTKTLSRRLATAVGCPGLG